MKVFVAGAFDCLHVGHFNLLLFCRQIAGEHGEIFVSIDTDEKIRKDKGDGRPIMGEWQRWKAIASIRMNGKPLIKKIYTHYDDICLRTIISDVQPDYIIVGSDYQGKNVIGSDKHAVIYFRRDDNFSTTDIIKACQSKKP
jgi:cytidyltransferase-like protein